MIMELKKGESSRLRVTRLQALSETFDVFATTIEAELNNGKTIDMWTVLEKTPNDSSGYIIVFVTIGARLGFPTGTEIPRCS